VGDGEKEIKKVKCKEKNILFWAVRAAKAEQKSLVPALQAQRNNQGWSPFICTFWVPIHHNFNS
jgi:hypothetical protein